MPSPGGEGTRCAHWTDEVEMLFFCRKQQGCTRRGGHWPSACFVQRCFADERCSPLRQEHRFPPVGAMPTSLRPPPPASPQGEAFGQKYTIVQRTELNFLRNKKRPGAFAPGRTPQMPCWPNYNLHKRAGGSPKFCFAASNVRPCGPGGLQSADSSRHPL